MKRLYLVRHAKSSWKEIGLADFDRPLNKRGKRDAPIMGQHLKNQRDASVDWVLCSTARRARATAKRLLKALGYDRKCIAWRDDIYGGSASELLALIQSIDDAHQSVMVIGHNPDMTDLAEALSGESVGNLPTCAVFGVDFDVGAWRDVGAGGGRRLFFDVPKQI